MQSATRREYTPSERLFSGVLALALLLSLVPFVAPVEAFAATTVVPAGGDLQAAIAAASPGDTLRLEAGEYLTSGQVVIDKNLTIMGAGQNATTIKNTSNTGTYAINSYATTGWFYVQPGTIFQLFDTTLDGGAADGRTVGAAVYSMGPFVASGVRVQNVKWSQYYGIGFVLMGPGHNIGGCRFESTVQRVGVYVGLAPTGGPAPDPAWDSIPYTALISGTFIGAGDVDWCQYGVEVGRGGRAHVESSSFLYYTGVAASDGSPSGGVLATSYYPTDGSQAARVNVDGCVISDCTYGVVAGYPYQVADTVVNVSNTLFDRVEWDLDVQGPLATTSVPTGSGNVVLDGFFEYNWMDSTTWENIENPPALAAGYYTLVAPTGSNLKAIIRAAADGDRIEVAAGSFETTGQVVIDKDLTIAGSGIGQTIVLNTEPRTAGGSITTYSTTGWFYVPSAGSLDISGLTLDGGRSDGKHPGAGIYAMGPLTADSLRVTGVIWGSTTAESPNTGVGLVLIGGTPGEIKHTVTNSTFDDIGRIGIYVGAAPEITAGDMDPAIEYGAEVSGCEFAGDGEGLFVQYGMEIGRSGRAHVADSTFSNYAGIASDGSGSAGLYVNSYWGVGTSKLVVDGSTIQDCLTGIGAGYPGDPTVPTDSILQCSTTTFDRVTYDLVMDDPGDVLSVPTGIGNDAPDHDWSYYWTNAGVPVDPPPALSDGFINWFPVGAGDAYDVQKNVALNVAAAGVLVNDTDADSDEITAALVTDVSNGTLVLNADGSFGYTPDAGFTGTDTFTYRAHDWLDASEETMVTLTVANDAPVAGADEYQTREGGFLSADAPGLLADDTDANGDPLTAVLVGDAGNGTLLLHPLGAFTYRPDPGFVGVDTFTYVADDGSAQSAPATVSITVVNGAPVAVDDDYETPKNTALLVSAPGVITNDTDADDDLLIARVASPATHGKAMLGANGALLYIPDAGYVGPDSFTYTVTDGLRTSAPATVDISVVNAAPVGTADIYTATQGVDLVVDAPGVLANDSDADGDAMTAVQVSGSIQGDLTLNADGSFSYRPAPSFTGEVVFTYKAVDADGAESAPVTVTITVNPPDVPPFITIQENEAGVLFGRYVTVFNPTYSGGGYVYTYGSGVWTGSAIEARFSGDRVRWIGPMQPSYGMADIYIDGVKVDTADCWASAGNATTSATIWESDVLPTDGWHTIKIVSVNQKNPASSGYVIVVDAFEVEGETRSVAGIRKDERSEDAAFTGAWFNLSNPSYNAAGYSYTRWAGTSYRTTFTGTRIAWIGPKTVDYGYARVYVDGQYVETVSQYGTTQWRAKVWESPVLSAGQHTLEIRPTGTKPAAARYAIIVVDAFDITP